MTRWRRLCIDISDDGDIIGASVEYYSERGSGRVGVAVMAKSAFRGLGRHDLLDELEDLQWPNPQLPLNWHMIGGEPD